MDQLLTRHSEPTAREVLRHLPGLLIEGAQQVGKTTLALQLIDGIPGALLLDMEDAKTRAAAREDPVGFVAQAVGSLMVIDEIQRVPDLVPAVLAAIDADPRPGRFIITSSSSLTRAGVTPDALAARVGRLHLYGFSQGELTSGRDDFVHALLSAERPTSFASTLSRAAYARLLEAGSYPDACDLFEHKRQRWLDDYVQGLVRRQMPQLRRIFLPDRAMSLLHILAADQAGELVKSRLAEEADIPPTTIDGYLDLLADTWLFATLPPWSPKLSDRELVRPKGFVIDTGLAARLYRITAEQLCTINFAEAFVGSLQAFVAGELLKQGTWTIKPYTLFHYRDRMGAQVDLVMQLADGRIIGIEVRTTSAFQAPQFKRLQALRDKLGDRFAAGVVLNTGQHGYPHDDRLYGLPVSALWQL